MELTNKCLPFHTVLYHTVPSFFLRQSCTAQCGALSIYWRSTVSCMKMLLVVPLEGEVFRPENRIAFECMKAHTPSATLIAYGHVHEVSSRPRDFYLL